MSSKTWRSPPLHTTIAEILERKGPLTDDELYGLLKEKYHDLGFGSLNKTLMKMEIEGKISVSSFTKGKRRVELLEQTP